MLSRGFPRRRCGVAIACLVIVAVFGLHRYQLSLGVTESPEKCLREFCPGVDAASVREFRADYVRTGSCYFVRARLAAEEGAVKALLSRCRRVPFAWVDTTVFDLTDNSKGYIDRLATAARYETQSRPVAECVWWDLRRREGHTVSAYRFDDESGPSKNTLYILDETLGVLYILGSERRLAVW